MGLGDIFKATDNKHLTEQVAALNDENLKLKEEIESLKAQLTPEHYTALNNSVEKLKNEELELKYNLNQLDKQKTDTKIELQKLKRELELYKGEAEMCECGVYAPKYDFETSDLYAKRLEVIKEKEKSMISNGEAAKCGTNWVILGSREKGIKMEKDTIKLLLRAFNNECDGYIRKVSHSNIETTEKHILTSYNVISKLAKVNDITISEKYLDLKKQELYLSFEYACKKQEEKEAAKEERARLREQAKLQKEIEEARQKLQKEREHYLTALKTIEQQLKTADGELKEELLKKQSEIQSQISDNDIAMQDVDYRAANQRAGYVYVISNIGAFGENVYKIGMTRRLDPMERVDELGDASVPFEFDVHAMIFSDDAPALEAALHKAFDDKKVNMINKRREFFRVSLDEIKAVVKANFDKTVEFTEYPEADQYRASLQILNSMKHHKDVSTVSDEQAQKIADGNISIQLKNSLGLNLEVSDVCGSLKNAECTNNGKKYRIRWDENNPRFTVTEYVGDTYKIYFCKNIDEVVRVIK